MSTVTPSSSHRNLSGTGERRFRRMASSAADMGSSGTRSRTPSRSSPSRPALLRTYSARPLAEGGGTPSLLRLRKRPFLQPERRATRLSGTWYLDALPHLGLPRHLQRQLGDVLGEPEGLHDHND